MTDSQEIVLRIVLDGKRMMDLKSMYSEFSEKLEFPSYFGENMNALYDMLTDLAWLSFSEFKLIIDNSCLILCNCEVEVRNALEELLADVKGYWAKPIELGQFWDRGAVSFEVVYVSC